MLEMTQNVASSSATTVVLRTGVAFDPPAIKVTLVRPPVLVLPRSLSSYGPVPPIGLAYIAAALLRAGHDVDVIDAAGEGIDQGVDFATEVGTLRRIGLSTAQIVERIDPASQMVGITHMFVHEWPMIRELVGHVRARSPEATIVVGGENATAFWPWMFEQTDAIDLCVLGEGEQVAVQLADRIALGQGFDGLDGIARAHSGRCDAADGPDAPDAPKLAARQRDLGQIERPAWDLLPLDHYWRYADFFGVERGRSLPVLGTRGCPYRCSFCSSPQMWTTRYSVRDPEDVAGEIAEYVKRYDVANVNFADLTAITKRSWALQFCDALERLAPGITWQLPTGTRAEVLDREVLQRLWDTGCRNLTYAPEAGGERMLEIYDKRVKLPHILESLGHAHDIGLVSKVNIIIGHPDERWPDVWKSLVFLVKAALAGADDAAVMMFGPYPGSADFTRLVESGRHVIDESAYYVGLSRGSSAHHSYNDHMTARQLRLTQLALLCTFYATSIVRRPSAVIRFVRGQVTGRERTALDALVRTKRRGFRPTHGDTPSTESATRSAHERATAGRRQPN